MKEIKKAIRPKNGPTAHGAIGPATYCESNEWPHDMVLIPATCDDSCHFYGSANIRELADWLNAAADYIDSKGA